MYLLDTNVISELRKSNGGRIDPCVKAWAASVPIGSQYLSVITVMEMEIGALQMERKDARQGRLLRAWLNEAILPQFEGRILGIDLAIARYCAQLPVPDPCSFRDSLIAATARVNEMTVVTRNISHFLRAGVTIVNPWEPQP